MAGTIRDWLGALELGHLSALFEENEVGLRDLSLLTDDDLRDLGLALGPRRRILNAVARSVALDDLTPNLGVKAHPVPANMAERRQLTVMFCDLVGSTELSQRLDPEDLRDLMRRYQDVVVGAVARYGGHVANFLGDGVLTYFGWPRAYEDQTERAVRAALDATTAVQVITHSDGETLSARVGIATGQVVVGDIIGGKRLCVDSNYYQTFNLPHVHLIDVRSAAIEEITATGIRQNNQLFEIDDLIIATGFDAMTGTLMKIDIRGREDARLDERWADGPSSYLGLAMADFPNLFTVTGPGSPSVFTNMLPTIEQHVEWITNCIGYVSSGNFTSIEASPAAEADWWQHVQDEANIALKSTTDSWYLGANIEGKPRVFMPYIGGFPRYIEKCEAVVANGYEGFIIC